MLTSLSSSFTPALPACLDGEQRRDELHMRLASLEKQLKSFYFMPIVEQPLSHNSVRIWYLSMDDKDDNYNDNANPSFKFNLNYNQKLILCIYVVCNWLAWLRLYHVKLIQL